MVVIENVDLTSDSSDAEEDFNGEKEIEELPFKCMKCPLKFGQIQNIQAHFLRAHQKQEKRVTFKDENEEFVFEKEDYEEDFSEIEDSFGTEIDTAMDTLDGGSPKNSQKGDEANYCSKCDRTFKSHLWFQHHLCKKHKKMSMNNKDSNNFCHICNKQYKSSMSYRNHKKNYHEGILSILLNLF